MDTSIQRPKTPLQDAVDAVCTFLELKPVQVDDDTLDSLANKIDAEIKNTSGQFAKEVEALAIDYTPLRLKNILNAVMIKHVNGTTKRIEDEDTLRTLYHVGVKQLDGILGSLTRDYCTMNCHHDEFHCCEGPEQYKHRFHDYDVLMLQEKEAVQHAELQIHLTSVKGCKYLNTDSGCTLNISKPPLCIGFLCGPIESHLREIAPTTAEDFIKSMDKVCSVKYTRINHERILALDKASRLGQLVIEESK